MNLPSSSLHRSRWAVGSLFFLHGLCFSTWGARIPSIQHNLHLSEASLGTLLFAIPVGSLMSMPLATWATAHFGSRRTLSYAILLYACMLFVLSLAPNVLALGLALILFGCFSNTVNISVNTQAVIAESRLGRSVMASLHGLWSLAGFIGAAIGAVMLGQNVGLPWHFGLVTLIVLVVFALNARHLLPEIATTTKAPPRRRFQMPDRAILGLGIIAFCSMISEGAMFDWSGVFFQRVIQVAPEYVGLGYASFMSTMAGTRFIADHLTSRLGPRKILAFSGALISLGLLIAVTYPSLATGLVGFLLVGAGTSAVVPLAFSEAGRQSSQSTSSAIASVSTIGFLGFLIGPPLIGWVAGATSLRVSFALVSLMGLAIIFVSRRQFR